MPRRVLWDPFTGVMEPAEEPKPQSQVPPQFQVPPQMAADYADAEQKTKAFLDGVHAKERRYLEAYAIMRDKIQNARTLEERHHVERLFDKGHEDTLKYRDDEVKNRDTAINNLWSAFDETWPSTTCKLTTATEKLSGKTYRTVEIDSPYLSKRVIGPTKTPEARHLIDESKGGFRALARQPEGFRPQGYNGGPPLGFGHPPSASRPGLGVDSGWGPGAHGHHRHHHRSMGWGPDPYGHDHYRHHHSMGWGSTAHDHHDHDHHSAGWEPGAHDEDSHHHHFSGWGPM